MNSNLDDEVMENDWEPAAEPVSELQEALELVATSELKPCPHCGGKAEKIATRLVGNSSWWAPLGWWAAVGCRGLTGPGCGASAEEKGHPSREEAVAAAIATWNRRTPECDDCSCSRANCPEAPVDREALRAALAGVLCVSRHGLSASGAAKRVMRVLESHAVLPEKP